MLLQLMLHSYNESQGSHIYSISIITNYVCWIKSVNNFFRTP